MSAALQYPLPNPAPELTALDQLATRSGRLASVVEAISRRKDTRERRARLMLLLVLRRCPPVQSPQQGWYVAGAVARCSPDSLARWWRAMFGDEPPTERTIRSHLGALSAAGALVRSPGDYLQRPPNQEHPLRRPRYPDTIHVLASEQDAGWWDTVGWKRLKNHQDARINPYRWRMLFGAWRAEAAELGAPVKPQPGMLPFPEPIGRKNPIEQVEDGEQAERRLPPIEAAAGIRRAVRTAEDGLRLVADLREVGVDLGGRNLFQLCGDVPRFRGAAAMLCIALGRRTRIRNAAGWLWRMFSHAPREELKWAAAKVRAER